MTNHFKPGKTPALQQEKVTGPHNRILLTRRALLKRTLALGVTTAIGGTISLFNAKPTLAAFTYDGSVATQWADQYAISSGTDYASQTIGGNFESWSLFTFWRGADDCTVFVSNAMYQGGFQMDSQWYSYIDSNGTWHYGTPNYHPWAVAPDLFNYLANLGCQLYRWQGPQRGINQTNGLVPGDLIFFSWKNDGSINHVAIQTSGGLDSNGNPFDQADAHDVDILDAFWTLEDYWPDDPQDIPDINNVAILGVHIPQNIAIPTYTASY